MTVRRALFKQALTGWSADDDRRLIDAAWAGPGVIRNGLAVGPNSPVAMNVVVQTGYVVVPADSAPKGKYLLQVTAPEVVTIAPASANNRTDIIVARVNDTVDGGDADDTDAIVAITGVTDGSDVAPATPANATLLATVHVLSTDSTIVAGRITDRRQPASVGDSMQTFAVTPGGNNDISTAAFADWFTFTSALIVPTWATKARVHVAITGYYVGTAANTLGNARAVIGAANGAAQDLVSPAAISSRTGSAFFDTITGLTAGVQTFKVQAQRTSGTGLFRVDPNCGLTAALEFLP